MTAYQLGLVVAMPIAGRVADSLGRKRVFMAAAVLFTTSSLLCGLRREHRDAHWSPSGPGGRRRCLHAFCQRHGHGRLRGAPPACPGHVLQHLPSRAPRRPHRRWHHHRHVVMAGHVLGQCADQGITFTLLAWRFLPSSPAGRPARLRSAALLLGGGVLGLMLAITDAAAVPSV